MVEVGERRRIVVAVAGEDVVFVDAVVVVAIVFVGLARGAAEASVAETVGALGCRHKFLSVAPTGAGLTGSLLTHGLRRGLPSGAAAAALNNRTTPGGGSLESMT